MCGSRRRSGGYHRRRHLTTRLVPVYAYGRADKTVARLQSSSNAQVGSNGYKLQLIRLATRSTDPPPPYCARESVSARAFSRSWAGFASRRVERVPKFLTDQGVSSSSSSEGGNPATLASPGYSVDCDVLHRFGGALSPKIQTAANDVPTSKPSQALKHECAPGTPLPLRVRVPRKPPHPHSCVGLRARLRLRLGRGRRCRARVYGEV